MNIIPQFWSLVIHIIEYNLEFNLYEYYINKLKVISLPYNSNRVFIIKLGKTFSCCISERRMLYLKFRK